MHLDAAVDEVFRFAQDDNPILRVLISVRSAP
jgi:hypothetical protein